MPIFDQDLTNKLSEGNPELNNLDLSSPSGLTQPGSFINPATGYSQLPTTLDQLSKIRIASSQGWDQPHTGFSKEELKENEKYPIYRRGVDLENIYGLQQSAWSQWGNSIVKFGANTGGIFVQGFTAIPNVIDAIRKGDFSQLSGDPDGFEGSIDNWLENLEKTFPNYYTRDEREHPWRAAIPFATGSANFWGDKFLKNLGFTAGAISSALVQDALITGMTGGSGTAPMLAAQAAKFAFYLNKIASVFKPAQIVSTLGRTAQVGGKTLKAVEALETLSTLGKLKQGAHFATTMLGASVTEAGVEAREGYRTLKEDLIKDYQEYYGGEPTGTELEEIEKLATDAMNVRFTVNTAILTLSNSMLFGNLARNIKAGQASVKGGFTAAKEGSLSGIGKFGMVDGSLDVFEKQVAKSFAEKAWLQTKGVLPTMFSEGVYEEGGQFATEKGVYDYFTRKYKNLNNPKNGEAWDSVKETVESIKYGLGQQFNTDEGLQNMFIGALTGMFVTGVQGVVDKKRGNDKSTRTQKAINSLNVNKLTGIFNKQYEDAAEMAGIAIDLEESVQEGDVFKYKNLNHDMFFKYLFSRARLGAEDITIAQLAMLKDLDKAQFEKTFGIELNERNKDTVGDYVNNLINVAQKTMKVFKKVNEVYKNPFTFSENPNSPEDAANNHNWNAFEGWKQEITYMNAKLDHLNSIKQEAGEIIFETASGLSGATITRLTNDKSLREIADELEEDAKILEDSIELTTNARERAKIRKQATKLRTLSGQASISANDKSISEDKRKEYFRNLASFENSGRDIDNEDGMLSNEDVITLYEQGVHINRADNARKSMRLGLEILTSESGFKKYLESEIDVTNQVKPKEKGEVNFSNEKGKPEAIQVGSNYERKDIKSLTYKKLQDGTYEVPKPDGTKVITKTEAQAKKELEDTNNTLKNMATVTVVGIMPNGAIKVEDSDGNIYDIDVSRLKGYTRVKTINEFIKEKEKDIKKIEEEGEKGSSSIVSINIKEAFKEEGGRRKHHEWLFFSTTTESETEGDVVTSPHIIRSRVFLNNTKSFNDLENYKLMLVTPYQIKALGLEGILEQSYKGSIPENVKDVNTGWMAAVFIYNEEQKDGTIKKFFVDQNGKILTEVGKQVDLNKVVYQTTPTNSLVSTGFGDKFRKEQKTEAEKRQKEYEEFRKDYYVETNLTPLVLDFKVSRGIALPPSDVNNRFDIEHLIPKHLIDSGVKLIQIPTNGTIQFQLQTLSVPTGVPMLQYRDVLEYLQNRKFNKEEAETIFELLKVVTDRVHAKLKKFETPSMLSDEWTYLQQVIYTLSKGDTIGPNQLRVNIGTAELMLPNKKNFAFGKLDEHKKDIVDAIQDMYQNVNNNTLVKNFHAKFNEYYLNDKGELTTREWKNYQTYLLSANNHDGVGARSAIPLTTNIDKPTSAVPYTHIAKYAKFNEFKDKPQFHEIEEEEKTPDVNVKIGEKIFNLNGVATNEATMSTGGKVTFTGVLKEDGKKTTVSLVLNEQTLATIKAEKEKHGIQFFFETFEQLANTKLTDEQKQDEQTIIATILEKRIDSLFEDALVGQKIEKEETPPKDVSYKFNFDGQTINKFKIELGDKEFTVSFTGETIGTETTINYASDEETQAAISAGANSPKIGEIKTSFVNVGYVENSATNEDVARAYIFVEINREYIKQGASIVTDKKETPPPKSGPIDRSGIRKGFRVVGDTNVPRMTLEDIEVFKAWHAKEIGTAIPFEELERVIQVNPTLRAWGVFENGVAKFYTSSERGTEYHEIFEGIWAGFLSEQEKQDILDEFRDDLGTFVDRASGKTYYKADPEVTDKMIKERIADDFADFRLKKIQAKDIKKNLLQRLFERIMRFFNRWIKKNKSAKDLFEAIDAGRYKNKKGQYKKSIPKDITSLTNFEGTQIEWVDHIGFGKDGRQIGARNIGKGKKILVNRTAMEEKFKNKTWTNPMHVAPLPENYFTTFEEFIMFMFLHEKAHEYIYINEGESKASYETRINNEAASRLEEEFLLPQYSSFQTRFKIADLTEKEVSEYVEDMTAVAAARIFDTENNSVEKLFNYDPITKQELFTNIENFYTEEEKARIDTIGWAQLVERTIEKLRTIGIEFNEDNEASINEEASNSREYVEDPFVVNAKESAPIALKFLLSTLPKTTGVFTRTWIDNPELAGSPNINGMSLLPYTKVFGILIDRLANSNSIEQFVDKLGNIAQENADFVRLFKRLGGTLNKSSKPSIDFDSFNEYNWRLFIQFYQTFSKQFPDAIVQFRTRTENYSMNINKLKSAKDVVNTWIDGMKGIADSGKGIIFFDKNKRVYKIKPLKPVFVKNDNGTVTVTDIYGVTNTYPDRKEAVKAIKKDSINIDSVGKRIEFLNSIGIGFTAPDYKRLSIEDKEHFNTAVASLHAFLGENNELYSLNSQTLSVKGSFGVLADLFIKASGLSKESTHFGVDGKRRGNYTLDNTPSMLENDFLETKGVEELKTLRPELNDVYSANSKIFEKGGTFVDSTGKWRKRLKISYIQGTKDETARDNTTTSDLVLSDRLVQEINQNVKGQYYIIMPADGSTEWMVNTGNIVPYEGMFSSKKREVVGKIFEGYLRDEINLALDYKNRTYLRNIEKRAKKLRMFGDLLPEQMVKEIEALIEDISNNKKSITEVDNFLNDNRGVLYAAIYETFIIEEATKIKSKLLDSNKVFFVKEDLYSFPELDTSFTSEKGINKDALSEEQLNNLLEFITINTAISNIEMHKIIFGDPFIFANKAGISEAIKRLKSFFSPAKKIFNFDPYNDFLNRTNNVVAGKIQLTDEDYGHHTYKSHASTTVLKSHKVAGSLKNILEVYGNTDVTDGFSWIMDATYKEVLQKNGQWNNEAEDFHQWQMAFTRQNVPGYKYTNKELEAHDKELMKTSAPEYYLKVLKPIVRGAKGQKNHIDLALDKFAQMPVYYSMVKGTNLEQTYLKMFKEKIDYALVESARKIGVETTHSIYNGNGSFNNDPYNNISEIPWKIYSIQVETAHDDNKQQTRGSQITKMATMNLFENGEAMGDTPERQEYIEDLYYKNTEILDEMHRHAYNSLLRRLGIEDRGGEFVMENGKKVSRALVHEMLRRDVNENTKNTVKLDEEDQFIIPFEASPSYIQIKDIMYSLINKTLLSPQMSGGTYVQVSSAQLEKMGDIGLAMKTEDGWIEISKTAYEKLSDEEKQKVAFTDKSLKFYEDEDGKRYCEIKVPHWFKTKFKGKFKTDEELLAYLQKNLPEVLEGIGFRIPTQANSSIEVFRVVGFLPQYMGHTVVVPAEITTKSGGDFDIDKLNMYLRSLYFDENGDIKLIRVIENTEDDLVTINEKATKEYFAELFDKKLEGKKESLKRVIKIIKTKYTNQVNTVKSLLSGEQAEIEKILGEIWDDFDMKNKRLYETLENLNDDSIQEYLREAFVDNMYKKALENEYYISLSEILTLPELFNALISPIDDGGYKDVANEIIEAKGKTKPKNVLISKLFLTEKRNAFALAKRWIGIAAVNITGLSNRQKAKVYFDPERVRHLGEYYGKYVGTGEIQLPHNTVVVDGKEYLSISGVTTKENQVKKALNYISNRLSGFATATLDVATDDYILDIYPSGLLISSAMFLEASGTGNLGRMFLAQPIIQRYVEKLDYAKDKRLHNDKNIEALRAEFPVSADFDATETEFNSSNFKENISIYANAKSTTEASMIRHNEEQIRIFNEFLKVAILGKEMFKFNQAMNYDTSKIRNGEQYLRKKFLYDMAVDYNLFVGIEDVMENTFIGLQKELMDNSINMLGTIFKLDQPKFKEITNSVLLKYAEREYITDDDFSGVIQEVKLAYLDYLIQSDKNISREIDDLLLSDNNIVTRINTLKEKYPELQILHELVPDISIRKEGAKTIKLLNNDSDVFNDNYYIGLMRELRDFNTVETKELYNDIITMAILQGSKKTSSSIKHIIPIEDYSEKVKTIIENTIPVKQTDLFSKGMFERNQHSNTKIMPVFIPSFETAETYNNRVLGYDNLEAVNSFRIKQGLEPHVIKQETTIDFENQMEYTNYLPKGDIFKDILSLGVTKENRKVMVLNSKFNRDAIKEEFLRVPRVIKVENDITGVEWLDLVTNKPITYEQYKYQKDKGDGTLFEYLGYQKVRNQDGSFLTLVDSKGNEEFVYKQINLLGEGRFLKEYYDSFKPSAVDNTTVKVKGDEVMDVDLLDYFSGKIKTTITKKEQYSYIKMSETSKTNIKNGTKTITNRSEKEYLEEGIYKLETDVFVNIKNLGRASVTTLSGQRIIYFEQSGIRMNVNEYAKKEGFKDWTDFEKNAQFSEGFIKGNERRWIFEVKIVPLTDKQKEEAAQYVETVRANMQPKLFDVNASRPNFDTLPEKGESRTFTYAGVGSRQTPPEVAQQMTAVASWLSKKGYTLNSGGAVGADIAFEKGAGSKKEIFKKEEATTRTKDIAKEVHPNPGALKEGPILDLLARNTYQVFGKNLDTPVDFVLAWTPKTKEGKVVTKAEDRMYYGKNDPNNTGGTGQAIAMASLKGIPVINMAAADWKKQITDLIAAEEEKETFDKKEDLPEGLSIIKNSNDGLYDVVDHGVEGIIGWGVIAEYIETYEEAYEIAKNFVREEVKEEVEEVDEKEDGNETPEDSNLFKTKVDQFNYTYNPQTGEVIHNAKAGDKIEDNETQIGKVLANYAKENNLETKEFNKQTYAKVGDRIVNINTGSIVTQQQIAELFETEKVEKKEVKEEVKEETPSKKFTFSYRGKSIETEFPLSHDQTKALEEMIDFMNDPSKPRHVLQGAAGTGKTAIIGYLQKYLNSKILYMAPTHAATIELAFGTMKSGNKEFPMTVASSTSFNKKENSWQLSKKAKGKLGFGRTIVVDETSMLGFEDYQKLKALHGFKVIFVGDKKQIPEVSTNSTTQKAISLAFTENPVSNLDRIHRTSNKDIKSVLQKVRDSIIFQLYKTKNNTENLKFYKNYLDFRDKLREFVLKDPENTDYIGYTNASVSSMNKMIREELFNRTGPIQVGDIIMGYLGYASKQVDDGNLANSVSYTVTDVEKRERSGMVGYAITMESQRLKELAKKGFNLRSSSYTTYLPLSKNESLDNDLTEEEYRKNNEKVSQAFHSLYLALEHAKKTNYWVGVEQAQAEVGEMFSKVDLGADYIYNSLTKQMEPFNKSNFNDVNKLKALYGNQGSKFKVEKGIDYGHAITVHKSQGRTTKNVFFDANTIGKQNDINIMEAGVQISTERQSLGYVGLSRASENLFVNEGWVPFLEVDNVEANTPTPETPKPVIMDKPKVIKVESFVVTLNPDGSMYLADGSVVTEPLLRNKVLLAKENVDGTLRISNYKGISYFVLTNNTILGATTSQYGKDINLSPEIQQVVIEKATIYKKDCK